MDLGRLQRSGGTEQSPDVWLRFGKGSGRTSFCPLRRAWHTGKTQEMRDSQLLSVPAAGFLVASRVLQAIIAVYRN